MKYVTTHYVRRLSRNKVKRKRPTAIFKQVVDYLHHSRAMLQDCDLRTFVHLERAVQKAVNRNTGIAVNTCSRLVYRTKGRQGGRSQQNQFTNTNVSFRPCELSAITIADAVREAGRTGSALIFSQYVCKCLLVKPIIVIDSQII